MAGAFRQPVMRNPGEHCHIPHEACSPFPPLTPTAAQGTPGPVRGEGDCFGPAAGFGASIGSMPPPPSVRGEKRKGGVARGMQGERRPGAKAGGQGEGACFARGRIPGRQGQEPTPRARLLRLDGPGAGYPLGVAAGGVRAVRRAVAIIRKPYQFEIRTLVLTDRARALSRLPRVRRALPNTQYGSLRSPGGKKMPKHRRVLFRLPGKRMP